MRDTKSFAPVTQTLYRDLPEIKLTPEEFEIVQAKHNDILNKRTYQKLQKLRYSKEELS